MANRGGITVLLDGHEWISANDLGDVHTVAVPFIRSMDLTAGAADLDRWARRGASAIWAISYPGEQLCADSPHAPPTTPDSQGTFADSA